MEKPIFKHRTIAIAVLNSEGQQVTENHRCLYLEVEPNIVITMVQFGRFDVTHAPSGLKMLQGFERVINAQSQLVSLVRFIIEKGVDASVGAEEFRTRLQKLSDAKMSSDSTLNFGSWLSINRNSFTTEEFPWENEEEGPHAELTKKLRELETLCGSQ